MYSKFQQLKKRREASDLSTLEKNTYFTWIKDNKSCLVCGDYPEIHHVTNKSIQGKRRLHSRVVPLCFSCHSAQSDKLSIHGATDRFYQEVISLEELISEANKIYEEFLNEKN